MAKIESKTDEYLEDDIYTELSDTNTNISWDKIESLITSNHKQISKYLLFRFFQNIDKTFLDYGLKNINDYIDAKFNKYTFNLTTCENWFNDKNDLTKSRPKIFGSYFYFGDKKYIIHVAVGLANLHIGIVKYSRGKNRNIQIESMTEKDFDEVFARFGIILSNYQLKRRIWDGIKLCSIDCGGFLKTERKEVASTMLNFSDSQICNDIFIPFIKELPHDNSIPLIFKKNETKYAPYTINFRITYKCNIQCRHCYNNSNNKETICIDRDAALKVIKEGFDFGIRRMSITGGEPLLYPKLVLEMLKTAIDLGYENVSFKSNGFWGKTLKSAEKLYSELKGIGFAYPVGGLSLSAGEFHSEFLNWNHISNIVIVHYKSYNRPLGIDFEYTKESSHLVEQFRNHMIKKGVDEKCYKLNLRTNFANVGRMKDNYELYRLNDKRLISTKKLICRPEKMFTVEPDGDILPCCGYNRYIKDIALGNIYKESFLDIVQNTINHKAMNLLMNKNFEEIQNELFGENNNLPKEYSSVCEACEKCFGPQTSEHKMHFLKPSTI